jgi:superfamily II DNA or RNA helicase
VYDEAHHYVSPEWSRVLTFYRDRLRVGLTATPCRADGVALGSDFDVLIEVATVAELTAQGFLVPCTVLGPPRKLKGVAMTPVDAYRKHTFGGHAIVFCSTVQHAENTAASFREAGFAAECVEGSMAGSLRASVLRSFATGDLHVVCNVHVLTEGTDLPIADTAILASGCSHDGAYLQKVGRILRPYHRKDRAIVLDLVGSSLEFGLPSDPRIYSLDGRPIRVADGLEPLRQCPKCGGIFRAGLYVQATCPRCGFRCPARKDPAVRRAELHEIRAGHSEDTRRAAYLALVAEGRARGFKPGRAAIVFKSRYGRYPNAQERTVDDARKEPATLA